MVRLTRREREIASLVAQGLTNREIAERLFIAERTAEGHVESIRNKLGFRSRTQIAAWFVEQERTELIGEPDPAQETAAPPPTPSASTRSAPSPWLPAAHPRAWFAGLLCTVIAAGAGTFAAVRAHRTSASGPVIQTIAGTGARAASADGAQALSASLDHPVAVAVEPSGAILLIEGNRVRRVTAQGTMVTVAGTGDAGYAGDGGPATAARLNAPQALAVRNDGSIFIADTGNSRIRRVDARGVITTVAGTGEPGFSGDGGPATGAQLTSPAGVAIGFGGRVLVADSGDNRVREIDSTGIITTVAGTGDPGYLGDGGQATSAEFDAPQGIVVDAEDALFIVDAVNDRIRRVDVGGIVTTVAGSGAHGFGGDGGPATEAAIDLAAGPLSAAGQAVAVDAAGDIFISDALNNRIREVDVHGIISTVVGDGDAGYSGDQGAAADARLDLPLAVAVGQDGTLYIADSDGNRIRRASG